MVVFHDKRTPLMRFCWKNRPTAKVTRNDFCGNYENQENFFAKVITSDFCGTAKVTSNDFCGKSKLLIFFITCAVTYNYITE